MIFLLDYIIYPLYNKWTRRRYSKNLNLISVYHFLVQILSLYGCIELIDVDKTVEYVSKLQQADGSFVGDKWGL